MTYRTGDSPNLDQYDIPPEKGRTIDEAIKILTAVRDKAGTYRYGEQEIKDATKLGIEALKEVRRHRRPTNLAVIGLLPGEMEE